MGGTEGKEEYDPANWEYAHNSTAKMKLSNKRGARERRERELVIQ